MSDEHRHIDQRGGEDHRDHTTLINLERQVGGGAAVLAPAHHALGVLYGNAALALFHKDHTHNQDDNGSKHKAEDEPTGTVEDIGSVSGNTGSNAGKDEQ